MDDDEEVVYQPKKEEPPPPRRRPKKLKIPRRTPSVVIPPRKIVFITPDKVTCKECICFPKEEPYQKPKKLNPCQFSPETLYELAAKVVDNLRYPEAYVWSEEAVADWIENVVGLPQYRYCILDNHINGRRLLMLEDPSHFAEINIRYMDHIKMITAKVRELFSVEFVLFARSIGLPPRKPLTHCTWFKSRTGPTWGVRQNWSRSDVLRWMKILGPEPWHMDHWDRVWYWKPDFPKTMFARLPPRLMREHIPIYRKGEQEPCREYMTPRRFHVRGIVEDEPLIWMEHRPGSPIPRETELVRLRKEEAKRFKPTIPKPTRLHPQKISLEGLAGKELILAKRLMPKKKFMVL